MVAPQQMRVPRHNNGHEGLNLVTRRISHATRPMKYPLLYDSYHLKRELYTRLAQAYDLELGKLEDPCHTSKPAITRASANASIWRSIRNVHRRVIDMTAA